MFHFVKPFLSWFISVCKNSPMLILKTFLLLILSCLNITLIVMFIKFLYFIFCSVIK